MAKKPVQVIGLCRFSYPALGGFQVEHEDIDDRIAYLYAPERLNERFALFETVVLPGLKAQTDQNFDIVIVVGDQMPADARARLDGLVADLPQANIVALPPMRHRDTMKMVLRAARLDASEGCIQFRIDDDDAVAVDYVACLRKAAQEASGLCANNNTVAFDWTKGYIAEFGPDGIRLTETDRPTIVAGLGVHIRGDCPQTVMSFSHMKIPRHMPTIRFPKKIMYVRGFNDYNDSRQKKVPTIPVEPATAEELTVLRDRFAIDQEAVKRAFAALASPDKG